MSDKAFFDSNIVVYAVDDIDSQKAGVARCLLADGGTISVQVLNEVANVCLRKLRLDWPVITGVLCDIKDLCTVVPLTVEIHECGLYVAERYKLSLYDAMIIAAALLDDCAVVYSEYMHTGLAIEDRLHIVNPFV